MLTILIIIGIICFIISDGWLAVGTIIIYVLVGGVLLWVAIKLKETGLFDSDDEKLVKVHNENQLELYISSNDEETIWEAELDDKKYKQFLKEEKNFEINPFWEMSPMHFLVKNGEKVYEGENILKAKSNIYIKETYDYTRHHDKIVNIEMKSPLSGYIVWDDEVYKLKRWDGIGNLFTIYKNIEDIPITENAFAKGTNTGRPCYVYIMKDESLENTYKIGNSFNPTYREKTLRADKPTITCLKSKKFESKRKAELVETELHKKYSANHLRGEWFKLTDRQVKNIENYLS